MKCIKGKEIQVLHSAAGWYIGCYDDDGPCCRISMYYKTREHAETALEHKLFYRDADEITFCNRNWGCIPEWDVNEYDPFLDDPT